MISEDTYITNLPHKAVRALGAEKSLLAKTIVEMCERSEGGTCEISQEYLIGVLGIKRRTLQDLLMRLRALGIIASTSSTGRGHNSVFAKGANFDELFAIKGAKSAVFNAIKGAKTCNKRRKICAPNIITAIIAAKNAPAQVREQRFEDAAADGERAETGSPRQTEERKEKPTKESKKMVAQQFEEFWTLFHPAAEFETRKHRCEQVFSIMSPEYRMALLNELRSGANHRANPLHHLQYYRPAEVKPEFPIFRNGDLALNGVMKAAENGGRTLACVEAGERLHLPDRHAFVYLDDAKANKLTIVWTIPKGAK